MACDYPYELEAAFMEIRNGENTVSKKDLTEMFLKLELEEEYIEVIIAQLSLASTDLEHLNFLEFFMRFYLEKEGQEQNQPIEQQGEQSEEESYRDVSHSKKHSKKSKLPVDEE